MLRKGEENVLDIGSSVWNSYNGLLRFGRITSKEIIDGWAEFKVTWFDDGVYESRVAHREDMTKKDYKKHTYRANELHPIEIKRLEKVAYLGRFVAR